MTERAGARSSIRTAILYGPLTACVGAIGVGIGSSWALPRMIPAAIGAGVGVALCHGGLIREAPVVVRFVAMLAIAAAVAFGVHLLLSLLQSGRTAPPTPIWILESTGRLNGTTGDAPTT